MIDDKDKRIENLEQNLSNEKESHTSNVFLLLWIIGLVILAVASGGDGLGILLGGWIVVALAWVVAKKFTS